MGNTGSEHHIQVKEIYRSLQGEGRQTGEVTTFLRTAGCNLRCQWCDSQYSQEGGEALTLEQILDALEEHGCRQVCVTGGEPLIQEGISQLFSVLKDAGYHCSVETNGTIDIGEYRKAGRFVVDYKLSSSGAGLPFEKRNFQNMDKRDELKFVIADRSDYEEAREVLRNNEIRAEVIFSPCWGRCSPQELARWMVEDAVPARMSLQVHKVLWGNKRGV